MDIQVEPQDGRELDRLITALLNASGVVHRAIEAAQRDGAEGVEIISRVAERLRGPLAIMAELSTDEELAVVTQALARITVVSAAELGLGHCFGR